MSDPVLVNPTEKDGVFELRLRRSTLIGMLIRLGFKVFGTVTIEVEHGDASYNVNDVDAIVVRWTPL